MGGNSKNQKDCKNFGAISIASIVIASITGVATFVNFLQDWKRVKVANEVSIRNSIDEVWDLIGGHNGTIWITANLARPEEFSRLEKARRILDNEILVKRVNHKRGLELKGLYYMKIGELGKSLSQFQKVIQLYPNYPSAYKNLGNVWDKKGELDRALEEYDKALKLDSKFALAYNNRGIVWDKKGELDRALEEYDKALKHNPKFAYAYNNRGNVWDKKGKLDRALEDYNNAIRINPSLVEAYHGRGKIWYKKRDYKQAIADYTKATKIDPNYAKAYNGKAWLLATCQNDEYRNGSEAIVLAKKAVELNKEYEFLDTLAAAYAESGKFEEAIETQREAITLLKKEDKAKKFSTLDRLNSYIKGKPWREK